MSRQDLLYPFVYPLAKYVTTRLQTNMPAFDDWLPSMDGLIDFFLCMGKYRRVRKTEKKIKDKKLNGNTQ